MPNSVFLSFGSLAQNIGAAADNTATPPFTFLGDLTSGYGSSATGVLDIVSGATSRFRVTTAGAILPSTNYLAWGSSAYATPDAFAYRAGTKALTFAADNAGANLNTITFATLDAAFNGNVHIPQGGQFYWGSRTLFSAPGNGTLQIGPNAGTTGITWDNTTDGTAWLKTFAAADSAILKSSIINATSKFQQNGTDGVTAGPFTVITGITVKGGIVTALTGS